MTGLRAEWASEAGTPFLILLGAVGFVLLIVCANLAALVLSRASGRRRELAVRAALGAGRWQLVRQLLAESLVVGVLGGGLACGLAFWGVDVALSAIRGPIPYWLDFTVDARVLAFCLATAVAAGVGAGVLPAMQASRTDVSETLKDGAPAGTGSLRRNRVRAALIVSQMALTLVLLSGAGLLVKTFVRLTRPAAERDMSSVLLADLDFLDRRYGDPGQILLATEAIVARLAQQPGVVVGASHWWFIAGFGAEGRRIAVEGMSQVPEGTSPRFAYAVTPGFFDTQGLRIIQGRDLTAADRAGAAPVVIVNEQMAQGLWGSEPALGRRVQLEAGGSWATVVGVVGNLDAAAGVGPARRPSSLAYVPLAQRPGGPVQLSARTPGTPASFASAVRAAVRDVDPDLPVQDLRTAEEDQARSVWPVRFFALLMSPFAGFAVLLSTLGTYGVLAYLVGQRTREIGIRLAVGAARTDVLRMVLMQGAALGATGLALGLIGAAALTPVIRALLFGTSPVDPVVMGAVAVLFGSVTLLASYLPARRAAKVDPMVALRYE